ncbi:MAG: class I SAM-dependent methyltransferase [Hydrotalea sp.]|nr:class I SAM-dependent methyltransferase [Hydrotalea sp.]
MIKKIIKFLCRKIILLLAKLARLNVIFLPNDRVSLALPADKQAWHPHLKLWIESLSRPFEEVEKIEDCLPWLAYSAIEILKSRLKKNMTIFEYGSGASTIFWSQKVKMVVSVEHDKDFYEKTKNRINKLGIKNISLIYQQLDNDYPLAIKKLDQLYDFVIIDGRRRVDSMKACLSHLAPDGVILVDNSQREEYQPGFDFLIKNGFKKLDITSLYPWLYHFEQCSFFYRDKNCFNL